ncbi:MAG: hypothetical protein HOD90_08575 [Nitrospina sp.]|jgi:hypothetical protein|nr:hypothetical protein [Nitrospina sp.]
MEQTSPLKLTSLWSKLFFHTTLLSGIYFILILICYPVLINADVASPGDENYHFRQILEFIEGRFFLYYDNVTYAGILEGLAAIPFFWIFGVNFMAFKLPSILFFGLFIWSSFVLAKLIQPKVAWVWLTLLLFPSTVMVNHILTVNFCNSLTFFLANLILIYFYKYKTDSGNPTLNISLFGFFCGLSIYVYAYSIIYVFPVSILICLTHPKWESIRSIINFHTVKQTFQNLDSRRTFFIRILDILIICFLMAIAFAYTFGGFGLDIAGVTLLQINNLYKPVFQLLGLIVIRFTISKNSVSFYKDKISTYLQLIAPESKKVICYGGTGFLLGMSPRIVSILSGGVSRGGQGLDMDFLPTKMVSHAVSLFAGVAPRSLDLNLPFKNQFQEGSLGHSSLWYSILTLTIAGFTLLATFSFIKKHKSSIFKMMKLHQLDFKEELFFLLFPAAMLASQIITMNGPEIHYLAPMHWVATLYVSIFLVHIQSKSKILFALLLIAWVTFYTVNNLNNFYNRGLISKGGVNIKANPLIEIVEFCKLKNLSWIYTNYQDTGSTYILSKGRIFTAEHTASVRGKRWKAELASHKNFAILLPTHPAEEYINFLQNSKIHYQKKYWKDRTLLWEFNGDPIAINKLRNLK